MYPVPGAIIITRPIPVIIVMPIPVAVVEEDADIHIRDKIHIGAGDMVEMRRTVEVDPRRAVIGGRRTREERRRKDECYQKYPEILGNRNISSHGDITSVKVCQYREKKSGFLGHERISYQKAGANYRDFRSWQFTRIMG